MGGNRCADSNGDVACVLALLTSLGTLDITSEWGGDVLWKLEVWIPNLLSGEKALNRNDYEPKQVKFLANLAFGMHCAICSVVENGSQSGPQGLLRKEHLHLHANVSGSGDFSSFFGLLFIVSYSQPSFTSWYLSWAYIALTLPFPLQICSP